MEALTISHDVDDFGFVELWREKRVPVSRDNVGMRRSLSKERKSDD